MNVKNWKKTKQILERMYPKAKKEATEYMKKILAYQEENKLQGLIYKEVFKFIPTEYLMAILVIKSVLEGWKI